MRLHRSLSVLGLCAATIAGAAVAMPTSAESNAGAEAEARPVLSITAATHKVTLGRSSAGVALRGLGAYIVAGDDPFEVAVQRASYSVLPTATWLKPDGNVALPDGLNPTDFRKFRGFFHIRVRDMDGKLVAQQEHGWCPNSWGGGTRSRPDAPDRSPYPDSCGGSTWTLGSFWGLQAGWADQVPGGRAKLAVGRYVATVRIDDAYRKEFGIPNDAAFTRINLRVVKHGGDDCRGCRGDDASGAEQARSFQPRAHEPAGDDEPNPGDPLPDLRAVPAWQIGVHNGNVLHFSANVWNAGPSTFVIDGFRRDGEDEMDTYQYFYDENGEPTGSAQIGTMHWHDAKGHHHWHFLDFARYELLNADKETVARSRKVSFCLAATDAIDYTVPGANWHPWNTDLSTACGGYTALSVREVLDVGSGDTYSQWRAGQAFRIKDLKNGVYYIHIQANPDGKVHEMDTTNNSSYRKIIIGGTPEHRTVRVPPVGLVDVS